MDPLTHGLASLALKRGFFPKVPRPVLISMIFAGTLADLDWLSALFGPSAFLSWNGGPLPPISSPLYLPIADELAERLDRPGDETPQGDPWLVRIPTSLVHLRADDQLPSWQQQPDGTWLPS